MTRPALRKFRTPRPLERDVQRVIVQFLELRGAVVVRVNSGAVKTDGRFVKFNSANGCSDLLACYRGRWLALECKRDAKEKPTADQSAFLDRVRAAGGVAAVVYDTRQVEAILNTLDEEQQ